MCERPLKMQTQISLSHYMKQDLDHYKPK